MSDAVVGQNVAGYHLKSVIGRGGMGTVYRAEDINLSRTVAIKRIKPEQQEREKFIHRFRSEAQALARIDSSHIVEVHALRETDIGLLIVMEYVEGGTLQDPIDEHGPLASKQAVPILEQTLQAFDDAHTAGVIHRDIKPENIMLTTDGMVKVTDFGIAKLRQPDSGETVTQGGQGGTLPYMSPEQISDISAVDARSDIYSLGMTAYKVFAGDLPFRESDTDFDIMRKVVEGEIPPPDESNAEIPSGIAQWILGAIAFEQDDRYQSAAEMKDALLEADKQSSDDTMVQPDWEVGDGSSETDTTQTQTPEDSAGAGDEDVMQTVVPGEQEDDPAAGGGNGETGVGEAPPPTTPPQTEASRAGAPRAEAGRAEEDVEETNWGLVAGGVVAMIVLAIGGYVAVTQMGGGGGEASPATLSLVTTPEGATVLVNGDTAGTTPLDRSVEAGAVQLQIRKDGFRPFDTTLTAKKGGQVALQDLQLARAASSANASPSGADSAEASSDEPSRSTEAGAQEQPIASAESSTAQTETPDAKAPAGSQKMDAGLTYTPAQAGLTGVEASSASLGDVDGNGTLDLLLTGRDSTGAPTATLYLGDGGGSFAVAEAGLTGIAGGDSEIGDVNGDGHLDLLLAGETPEGASATLYLGNGNGGFTEAEAGLEGVQHSSCALGDVNNDGHPDLLVTGRTARRRTTTRLYLGDGEGGFTQAEADLTGVYDGSVSLGDVNGDGALDILLTGATGRLKGRTATLYLGDGKGGFSEADADLEGLYNSASALGDVNGDGHLDLLLAGDAERGRATLAPTTTLYLGDGTGHFDEANAGLLGVDRASASMGDVNGDGHLDVVLAGRKELGTERDDSGTSATLLYLGDGQGGFTQTDVGLPNLSRGSLSLRAVDDNAPLDLILTGGSDTGPPAADVYF